MQRNQYIEECAQIIKNAKIDDLYLSSIGFNPSKNKGCCPIHSNADNKNGFSYTNKGGYRQYTCWTHGCVKGSDIIHLCKVKENLSNEYEAIKYLANMFNIQLPKTKYTEEDKEKFKKAKEAEKKKKNNLFKLDMAAKNSKDINRKFELSCLADNLSNNSDLEKINHANYVPNEKYYIDKYIGEKHHLSVLNMLLDDRNILAIAPPGSGKSREIIETCKRYNIKAIFVLPLAANVEQTANTYDIYAAYDKLDLIEALDISDNIVVCTWDKLQQLKDYDISEYKIILDEVHQIFTDGYREKAIDNMLRIIKRGKSRLDVTATPTMLDFSEYEHIVEYVPNKKTIKNIKMYDNTDTKTVLDIVNNPNNKSMVLINNKNILDMLSKCTNQKYDIVNADTKYTSKLYKSLMNESTMGDYKVLYHTTTLLASYNIKDTDITDIIIFADNELKNISNIIQDIARPRNVDNIRVHIFGKYKEECNVVQVEWLIKKDIAAWTKRAEIYNKTIVDQEFTTTKIEVNAAAAASSFIYYDKEDEQYVVDKVKIRAEIYRQYYNSRTIECFAALLEEYMDPQTDTMEIIMGIEEQQTELIKESKKAAKAAKKNAIEILESNKEILVGYNDISNGNVNYKLYNYMRSNSLDEDVLKQKYDENNIADIASIAADTIDLYTEYVLDYNYSYDLAWKLANMHHNTRTHKFINPMKNIIYSEILKKYPGEIIDGIDNRVYNYLVSNIKPGMSYISDHIELLSIDLINKFLDDKKYNLTNTRKLLNEIFSIKDEQIRVVTPVNFNFYINNNFTTVTKDRIRVYTVENILTIDDIKKELQLSSSDKSIEFTINNKVSKLISEFEAKKQIEEDLIKELFNIC